MGDRGAILVKPLRPQDSGGPYQEAARCSREASRRVTVHWLWTARSR